MTYSTLIKIFLKLYLRSIKIWVKFSFTHIQFVKVGLESKIHDVVLNDLISMLNSVLYSNSFYHNSYKTDRAIFSKE